MRKIILIYSRDDGDCFSKHITGLLRTDFYNVKNHVLFSTIQLLHPLFLSLTSRQQFRVK